MVDCRAPRRSQAWSVSLLMPVSEAEIAAGEADQPGLDNRVERMQEVLPCEAYLARANMKILVTGLGAMGTSHGWALAQAGEDVWHVVRNPEASRASGGSIVIDVLDMRSPSRGPRGPRDVVYAPKVTSRVAREDGFELVIIATKHYQAAEAVRAYRDAAPGAIFLLFTANWSGPSDIDALLPRAQYLWGYAASDGGWSANNRLMVNLRPSIRLGALPGGTPEHLDRVRALFANAGLEADLKENIIHWLWVHHALNAGTIGGALCAGGIPELTRSFSAMVETGRVTQEALSVVAARGVDVGQYPDGRAFSQTRLWLVPFHVLFYRYVLNYTEYGKRTVASGHFASNPREMKQFCFDVLRTAEALRVPAPHLAAMGERIAKLPGGVPSAA